MSLSVMASMACSMLVCSLRHTRREAQSQVLPQASSFYRQLTGASEPSSARSMRPIDMSPGAALSV